MDILLLLGLVLLNGVFAMSEIALVASRRVRLQVKAEEGDRGAAAALELGTDPTRFLSTLQIGITAIGILNGIVGQAALAQPLAAWLQSVGVDADSSRLGATALVVVIITYVTIVLGELVPKRLGQLAPEGIATLVARPITWLDAIARPFVHLLSFSTKLLLTLFGARDKQGTAVTEEEIQAVLAEGSHAGVIEQEEHAMVRNVFRLDERRIGSLMIPRGDIIFLDVEEPLEANLRIVQETAHTHFPVCRENIDDVLGVVSAKQLLAKTLRGERIDLAVEATPAVFVPETLTGLELLQHFRSSAARLALVIDEYGDIQGLVTLYDVLEAITGEFAPVGTEEAWAVQREDGSWLLDGLIPLPELKDRLGLRSVPEEERRRYQALAGMIMLLLGRVPQTGDKVDWENWRFEVVDMDGKRIDKVLAMARPPEAGALSPKD